MLSEKLGLKTSFQFSISSLLSEGASSDRDPGPSEGAVGGEARSALEGALREIPQVLGEGSTALWLFSSVQLLHCIQFFATSWTAACQASLSIINPRSSLKLMTIKLVMPSSHLILCCLLLLPLIFPASGSFQMSQFFISGGQSIGISASASVLPMNIQD